MFFLTMCGTAPVTPPAGAFELEVEESHWDNVYRAIEYIKRELHYKCEIGEKNEGYCTGANDYLNRTFDVLDEFWQ